MEVYPNPACSKVIIEIPGYFEYVETRFELYNSKGILVKSFLPKIVSKIEFNVEEFENGLYQMIIYDGSNFSNEKLLILH